MLTKTKEVKETNKIKVERILCAMPSLPMGEAAIRLIGSGKYLEMYVPIEQARMIYFLQHTDLLEQFKKDIGEERLLMEELLKRILPKLSIKEVFVSNLTAEGFFEAEVTIKEENSKYITVKAVPSCAIALGLIAEAEIFMNSELCSDLAASTS